MNVSTGIAGLDKILDGGMPKGTAVILEGPPGTGKTTIGIQFLYEGIIRDNETGIFITFEEFPDQIYKDMKSFGWDLRDLERKNKLRIIGLSPDILVEQMMMPDGLFEQTVKELDCKRLVIDSISLFRYLDGEEEGKNAKSFLQSGILYGSLVLLHC
ncbi:RAD55 family ATPase [Bacillus thermotolerans]|uniref:Circadian clock protein KaiC n=1 Tax=Bacillus thermotolerans TaxID=1221996 RepID=A0A0F5I4I8_BACTR|nr:ATPase domain-containing protein [Bacillus thermotolerans]KKB35620.1 Circadian clock protein KaiC [Bacillus thermotolerans]KKB40451.1 Circadian clock protein KaiC [Bacillus thermotolerans]